MKVGRVRRENPLADTRLEGPGPRPADVVVGGAVDVDGGTKKIEIDYINYRTNLK